MSVHQVECCFRAKLISERSERGAGADVKPMRARFRGAAELGSGRRQVQVRERQRLGTIEVDIIKIARCAAKTSRDVAASAWRAAPSALRRWLAMLDGDASASIGSG